MGVTVIESKDEFDAFLKANDKVVIDFTATWCGPCRMIGPKFEAMSGEAEFAQVKFAKVDVDEVSEVAEGCNVSAMPTFQMYKGGQKIDELVGASENNLREKIKILSEK